MKRQAGGTTPSIAWTLRSFSELTLQGLYDILALRQSVFVVEQRCAYLDMDGHDAAAKHLTGICYGQLVAYARILPPGDKFPECSIGRVVTHPRTRNNGFGTELMRRAIDYARIAFGDVPIRISAQAHLAETFYAKLGFQRCGPEYDEDGIQHVDMKLPHAGPRNRPTGS